MSGVCRCVRGCLPFGCSQCRCNEHGSQWRFNFACVKPDLLLWDSPETCGCDDAWAGVRFFEGDLLTLLHKALFGMGVSSLRTLLHLRRQVVLFLLHNNEY